MSENNRKCLKIWYEEFDQASDAFDGNIEDCKEFSYWITQYFMGFWYECKRKRVKTYIKYNLKRFQFVTKQKLNGSEGGKQSVDNKEVKAQGLASTLASEIESPLASLTTTITTTDTTTIKQLQTIEFRKSQFIEFISAYKEKYPSEMLNEFYRYWVKPSKKDETLMAFEAEEKFELGGRLATWFKKFKKNNGDRPELKKQIIESWSKKFNLSFSASKAKDNGVSAVIVSLEGNIKARAPEMASNEIDQAIVNMWNAVLQKWDNLEPFLAKQISFDRIASNFDNILIQINGSGIANKQKTGIDTTQFRRPHYE